MTPIREEQRRALVEFARAVAEALTELTVALEGIVEQTVDKAEERNT